MMVGFKVGVDSVCNLLQNSLVFLLMFLGMVEM